MRLIEGNQLPLGRVNEVCDICIVGAGAAGLYVATKLAQAGRSVVILEAGERIAKPGADLGIEALLDHTDYKGSVDGRFFGLGGSTSRWGGLIISHSDFDRRTCESTTFNPWDHIVDAVANHQDAVAELLKLDVPRAYDAVARKFLGKSQQVLTTKGLHVQAAEFLPFRKKNLSFLLDSTKHMVGDIRVFLGAVAHDWELEQAEAATARIVAVTARVGDRAVTIRAKSFVVAAGAIESTRLLLEINRAFPSCRIGSKSLGEGLSDHLSCAAGEVPQPDVPSCIRLFGPRFVRGRMRSFRFFQSEVPEGMPRSFSHFIFHSDNPGFNLAKKLVGSLQSRRLESVSASELLKGASGLVALGLNRYLKKRLYVPPDTPIRLQLDVEQEPHAANRIVLSEQLDGCGRPRAKIEWAIRPSDYRNIEVLSNGLLAAWPGAGQGLPDLKMVDPAVQANKPHDAYHPVGTCRMGVNQEAVVSPDLCVHGSANLYVLSTAVFPSAGTANPTFSMLCLGDALAAHLVN